MSTQEHLALVGQRFENIHGFLAPTFNQTGSQAHGVSGNISEPWRCSVAVCLGTMPAPAADTGVEHSQKRAEQNIREQRHDIHEGLCRCHSDGAINDLWWYGNGGNVCPLETSD